MANLSLEIKRVLKASAQRVYEAWTDADQLKQWHCPEGMTISYAQSDPEVGGRYIVNMVDAEGNDHRAVGEYLELTPVSKIVFTWDWEVGGGGGTDTRVTVLLNPIGADETELTLLHERFEEAEARDSHESGWSGALNNLAAHLS